MHTYPFRLLAIYVAQSAQDKFAFDVDCPIVVVADNVFTKISQTVNSQGVVAVDRKSVV